MPGGVRMMEANVKPEPVPTVLAYSAPESRRRVRLRASRALPCVWLPLGVLAMACALYACREYNRDAGTDLTSSEIAAVVASVHLGPFAGPVHSSSGIGETFYLRLAAPPLAMLVVGWLPFLFVRKPIHWGWVAAAWSLNVLAAATWYAGAMLSLAYWLS